MATRWDPTATSYTPQMLGGGAFSADQVQQLQQAGISMADLQNIGVLGPPSQAMTGGSQNYVPGGGAGTQNEQLGLTAEGQRQQQNAAMLKMMLSLGGGQKQQQGPPTPGNAYGQAYPLYATDAQGNPTGQAVYANPTNQMSLLGAAATESNPVINQAPSSALDPRSGVSKVGGALIGSTVPSTGGWTWNSLTSAFGLSPQDVPAFQAQGLSPQQAADKLNSTWNPVTQRAALSAGYQQSDIDAFKAQGLTPQQATAKFGVQAGVPTPSATPGMTGPWTNAQIGSVFTPVARTAPTQTPPLQAGVQPTATGYNPTAIPFAQAPAAPGLQIPQNHPLVAAHTSALEDAGKALYAHFGGDPTKATAGQIADFHDLLTGAIGATTPSSSSSPMANPLASGPPQPIPSQQAWAGQHGLTNPTPGSPAVQLPSGVTPPYAGFAPSSGFNPQPWLPVNVPAGTPATPQAAIQAAAGTMGGPNTAAALGGLSGTPAPPPKKMQYGGRVPGRGNEDTVPALLTPGEYVIPKPQVQQLMRTGKLPIKMSGGGSVQDPDPDPSAPPEARRKTISAQTSQAPPPAAPGGGSNVPSGLTSGLATAAHTYASSMAANLPRNPIGSGSGVDIRNTRLDPDPDLPSLKAAGMLGGGGMSQGMKSALGGIGSGLSQASQALAANAQLSWQMQPNAIPAPPPAPAAPQFAQPPAPQQAQQGANPYAAYAMNQARYPTSPYYS